MLKVGVIGAGIGGLVAALELALAGCAVTVIEKAAAPGGKARTVVAGGLALDAGPTVFTLKPVFEAIFAAAGEHLESWLELTPLTVLARHAWDDAARFDLYADPARTEVEIGDFAGAAAAQGYRRFRRDAAAMHRVLDKSFMRAERPSLPALLRRVGLNGLPALARIRPFTSLWRALGDYFLDPRLRQLFARYATYVGASPFAAPATLMLIAHVESLGVWQLRGGVAALASALAALCAARGVNFRYACEAREIECTAGTVRGLLLDDETRLAVDRVIANVDVAAIAAGMFGDAARGAVPAPTPRSRSLSAITWNMSATVDGPPFAHHNVFFAPRYEAEFDSLFARRQLPADPTVYVCRQSHAERTTGLLCLVNAPADGDSNAWPLDAVARATSAMRRRLASAGVDLRFDDNAAVVTTPSDFAARFPGAGGALYGPVGHGWRASFTRGGARSSVRGLYLAGGSVHPGPGVPMAALSGRIAAATLLADLPRGQRR